MKTLAGEVAADGVTVNGTAPPAMPTVELRANGQQGPITIDYNTAATIGGASATSST